MKVLVFCSQLLIWTLAQEYYEKRYDYFDVEILVNNQRLLKKYMNCFLDRGPCPPIGREFKTILPEVVTTKCAKCTPRQKRFARKVVDAFNKFLPGEHEELKKRLDPDNKYYPDFEAAIASL